MAPNSPACSFIHALIAGSRSTAPLNRSNSVLIVAPLLLSRLVGSVVGGTLLHLFSVRETGADGTGLVGIDLGGPNDRSGTVRCMMVGVEHQPPLNADDLHIPLEQFFVDDRAPPLGLLIACDMPGSRERAQIKAGYLAGVSIRGIESH